MYNAPLSSSWLENIIPTNQPKTPLKVPVGFPLVYREDFLGLLSCFSEGKIQLPGIRWMFWYQTCVHVCRSWSVNHQCVKQ